MGFLKWGEAVGGVFGDPCEEADARVGLVAVKGDYLGSDVWAQVGS